MPKRMRLPNGFGQISKIKSKRLRHPWRAMVTVTWDTETGKPIRKIIGYFDSYNEAYEALIEYHKDPDSPNKNITMNELYERWAEEHFKTIQEKSTVPYINAWRKCKECYDLKVVDMRRDQIKMLLEKDDLPPTVRLHIKNTLNLMLDYAIEHDIIEKNYSRILKNTNINRHITEHHVTFSEEELEILWKHSNDIIARLVLIQCYTGLRPGELLKLKPSDINTEDWTFVTGSKTDAGINRIVPVHERIREIILDFENVPYYKRLNDGIRQLELININEHKPHDGRKTFITRMKNANANEYAIKRIVGHAIKDLTEEVYTDRSVEWLHSEISKIV